MNASFGRNGKYKLALCFGRIGVGIYHWPNLRSNTMQHHSLPDLLDSMIDSKGQLCGLYGLHDQNGFVFKNSQPIDSRILARRGERFSWQHQVAKEIAKRLGNVDFHRDFPNN